MSNDEGMTKPKVENRIDILFDVRGPHPNRSLRERRTRQRRVRVFFDVDRAHALFRFRPDPTFVIIVKIDI